MITALIGGSFEGGHFSSLGIKPFVGTYGPISQKNTLLMIFLCKLDNISLRHKFIVYKFASGLVGHCFLSTL